MIGCVGSATYSLLPQLVRALGEELPGVDVNVRGEMLAPDQVSALLTGDIDLALLRPPIGEPGLQVETIRRDRLIVALPDRHPLARLDVIRLADLRDEYFVAHVGNGRSVMSAVLAGACADAGFVPRTRHEVQETSTLVTMVAGGLGVAIVPAPTAALEIAGIVYRALTPDYLGIDLALARRAGGASPLVDRAVELVKRQALSVREVRQRTTHAADDLG